MKLVFLGLIVPLAVAQTPAVATYFTPGTTLPATCDPGAMFLPSDGGVLSICYPRNTWLTIGAPASSIPSGLITLITSGTCPTGFSEAPDLDGVTVIGTLAAHGNVGSTGGSDNITPSGTVSQPSFTGTPGTVPAQTFIGSSATSSAVTGGTPAGTVAWPAGVPTFAGNAGTVPAEVISWPAGVPTFSGTPGTVPAQTFTGSSATSSAVTGGTPAGTVAWPAGVPTFAGNAGTVPAQVVSWPAGVPTFAGNALGTHQHTAGTLADATSGSTVKLFTASASGVSAATLSGSVAAASAGTPAGTVAWPAGVPTNATAPFTPAGTNAWPAGVPTFAGSALGTHQHTVTATGTNGTAAFTPAGANAWPAGVPTNATASFTPAGTNAWPAGVPTFSGNALGTHQHTVTATGANGTAAFTPAGTVSQPTFTGSQTDNRSAFVRAIFCRKN